MAAPGPSLFFKNSGKMAAAPTPGRVTELKAEDWMIQVSRSHIMESSCVCGASADAPCDYCRYLGVCFFGFRCEDLLKLNNGATALLPRFEALDLPLPEEVFARNFVRFTHVPSGSAIEVRPRGPWLCRCVVTDRNG
jgi:hypothetical protein